MANRSEIIIERTEQRSIAQIVQDTMHDVQDLVRSEIRLAKAEMEEKTRKAAKAGMLLAAGVTVGFLALCCAVCLHRRTRGSDSGLGRCNRDVRPPGPHRRGCRGGWAFAAAQHRS
jgi:hypothetical protein